MEEEIRLQKYFTDCGVMSRRAAEREIALGRVTVNGLPAVTGQKIVPGTDTVEYDGREVLPPAHLHTLCVMLNKPRGYLTTMSDDRGRHCVTELLEGVGERVYPVGRLDMYSEGLLLLTNDGELANALTHPSHGIPKIYRVTTVGLPDAESLERLRAPMTIDGYALRPVEVRMVSELPNNAILEMVLYEGRNRQIRKMCETVGIRIKRLVRVAVGEIRLGNLKCGQWKPLSTMQIEYLRQSIKKGEEDHA